MACEIEDLTEGVSAPRRGWEDRPRGMANNGRNQRRDRWPGFDLGGGGAGGPNQDRGRRIRAAGLLALGFLFVLYLFRGLGSTGGNEIPFSHFEDLVRPRPVTNVEVSDTHVAGGLAGQ